jgi:predicted MFS family arabinose efflux permease
MIIIGVILIIAFGLWERFLAPKAYLPFHLLLSGNVLGAVILITTVFTGYFCWDNYFTSYLQVVNGLSISHAGFVANIYEVGLAFFAVITGLLIRATGRFKWLAWVALLIQLLGGGLMIHFRQPGTNIGYICMCQVFISFGAGALYICGEMAVMSVAHHRDIATLLVLPNISISIGLALGSSISGGIWANTLPHQLALWLPDYAQAI